MQRGNSNERITSVSGNSTPRMTPKSNSSLFGLFTKRSTKVEPHPLNEGCSKHHNRSASASSINGTTKIEQGHIITFAKCTSDRQIPSAMNNSNNNVQYKSLTLPTSKASTVSVIASTTTEIVSNETLISVSRKYKVMNKSRAKYSNAAEEGSQSDGGEVILRKTPKHRSPNHNRFSHQFSLCCRADRKPMTPPISVRYNSIPDSNNILSGDNLSLIWNNADNTSLSLNSCDMIQKLPPLVLPVPSTHAVSGECASAPESPVTRTSVFVQHKSLANAQSSPSNSSAQSLQCDSNAHYSQVKKEGPIRPIPISACRSRLRLKLYPPGKDLSPLNTGIGSGNGGNIGNINDSLCLKKATTPQHMSSPNISKQFVDNGENDDRDETQDNKLCFISHENIQMHRKPTSFGSNLAKQALLSAQVLSLIPTEKARERSFLDGHLGSSSLLGPNELSRVLPRKEITIFVGTWNMNGQSPPKQMNDFVLPATIEHVPDLVVIGTQESSPDRFEWEVTIQETLGPSHVLFHSTTLGTLHLAIFMRRDLIWYCSAPEDGSFSVRTGSAFRTKGAVAISFCLFGTSMLFVTSHLTAHQQKVKERVSDVKRIIHALDLPKNISMRHKSKDVTQNFDNVFWCGDLNFRLSEPRENLLEWIQNTKFPLSSHLPHGYMHTDQLSSVLSDGAAFRGFMEANITFPPSYKYDPGSQNFDTSSKQRAPAYTDRILYKYRQTQGLPFRKLSAGTVSITNLKTQLPLECLLYDSVPSIITSDHKPVWALFKAQIRAGTDAIPLAAGLFSRDIYLEGMKRRLHNKYSGSSAICAIQ